MLTSNDDILWPVLVEVINTSTQVLGHMDISTQCRDSRGPHSEADGRYRGKDLTMRGLQIRAGLHPSDPLCQEVNASLRVEGPFLCPIR